MANLSARLSAALPGDGGRRPGVVVGGAGSGGRRTASAGSGSALCSRCVRRGAGVGAVRAGARSDAASAVPVRATRGRPGSCSGCARCASTTPAGARGVARLAGLRRAARRPPRKPAGRAGGAEPDRCHAPVIAGLRRLRGVDTLSATGLRPDRRPHTLPPAGAAGGDPRIVPSERTRRRRWPARWTAPAAVGAGPSSHARAVGRELDHLVSLSWTPT